MEAAKFITMEEEEEEEAQSQVDIWKYVFGFTEMAVVKCAIELGIADVLETRPMTLEELSSALSCSTPLLYRIMRFLIHRKIFKEIISVESTAYVQTPLSRLLMKKDDKSMAAFVLLESSPVMLAPWLGLSARALGTDSPAFTAAHGQDVWRYAEANPAHNKLINDAMACHARVAISAILDSHADAAEVFKGVESLVDVGGGDGTTLGILVNKCPWIHGINFDLPHVVSTAQNWDGVEHVGGNMFEKIPKADAALLMWVLHDWGDEECINILNKCREAIPGDKGKVIIAEAVIDGGEEDKFKDVGLALDMVMMAHTDKGKERTFKEWANVLSAAGFTRFNVKHIQAVQSIIVAYP